MSERGLNIKQFLRYSKLAQEGHFNTPLKMLVRMFWDRTMLRACPHILWFHQNYYHVLLLRLDKHFIWFLGSTQERNPAWKIIDETKVCLNQLDITSLSFLTRGLPFDNSKTICIIRSSIELKWFYHAFYKVMALPSRDIHVMESNMKSTIAVRTWKYY